MRSITARVHGSTPAFIWSLCTSPHGKHELGTSGWKTLSNLFYFHFLWKQYQFVAASIISNESFIQLRSHLSSCSWDWLIDVRPKIHILLLCDLTRGQYTSTWACSAAFCSLKLQQYSGHLDRKRWIQAVCSVQKCISTRVWRPSGYDPLNALHRNMLAYLSTLCCGKNETLWNKIHIMILM